jgi:hypothetical protein
METETVKSAAAKFVSVLKISNRISKNLTIGKKLQLVIKRALPLTRLRIASLRIHKITSVSYSI